MAKHNLYSIQDVLIGFNAPMIGANDEAMARDYKAFLRKKDTNEQKADMRLFKIGVFDDITGQIEAIQPELMIGGIIDED